MTARAWSEAWHEALYGPEGFFLREVPGTHFRTNAAVPLFAAAVRRLADRVDEALGFPDPFDVVDVGAGRGELLSALPDVPTRWRLTGVDLATADVPFRWAHEIPALTGLLVANEWLDAVPLDVLEDDRLVLVSPSGEEQAGAPLTSEWAARWWPTGGRVEIGAPRDLAWAHAVSRVRRGLAVAVDYGHTTHTRRPTLTGYRDGRQVPPVPDGSCDLTAHVALDACAAATGSLLVTQREALAALGVSAALPDPTVTSYGQELERASQARELLDPAGLGGFGWLLRAVGTEVGWMGV
ncbi:MAG: SAM-dependent methyltransferase [Mycobacteriales bacterium]